MSVKVILLVCDAMQPTLHSDRIQSGRPSIRCSVTDWNKRYVYLCLYNKLFALFRYVFKFLTP
jgi:hypothetical protein